jgi:hypothetical protein
MGFYDTGFESGTLDVSAVAVLPIGLRGRDLPLAATLKSAAGGRKIEVSTDGGTEYFQPTVDVTSATQLTLVLNAPVTHIKFTGAQNDTWRVI